MICFLSLSSDFDRVIVCDRAHTQALTINSTCAEALVGSDRLEQALKSAADEANSSSRNSSADMSDSKEPAAASAGSSPAPAPAPAAVATPVARR